MMGRRTKATGRTGLMVAKRRVHVHTNIYTSYTGSHTPHIDKAMPH